MKRFNVSTFAQPLYETFQSSTPSLRAVGIEKE